MSRSVRLLVILAAWAIPVVWIVAMLGTRPSDGSVVWSSPLGGGDQWGSSVVVRETYGDTPLLPGDELLEVDGVEIDRLAGRGPCERPVGGRRGHLRARTRRERNPEELRPRGHPDPLPARPRRRRGHPRRPGRTAPAGRGRGRLLRPARVAGRAGVPRLDLARADGPGVLPVGPGWRRPRGRSRLLAARRLRGPLRGGPRPRPAGRRHPARSARLAGAPPLGLARHCRTALRRVRRVGGDQRGARGRSGA